jgi:hypothetical protein
MKPRGVQYDISSIHAGARSLVNEIYTHGTGWLDLHDAGVPKDFLVLLAVHPLSSCLTYYGC